MRDFDPRAVGRRECGACACTGARRPGSLPSAGVCGQDMVNPARTIPTAGSTSSWCARTPNRSTLVEALTALYAHVYRVEPETVRLAATERAEAMAISDRWVADGCDPASAALHTERAALVRSYAALLAAVHNPEPSSAPASSST